jgi:hypothetical protein
VSSCGVRAGSRLPFEEAENAIAGACVPDNLSDAVFICVRLALVGVGAGLIGCGPCLEALSLCGTLASCQLGQPQPKLQDGVPLAGFLLSRHVSPHLKFSRISDCHGADNFCMNPTP